MLSLIKKIISATPGKTETPYTSKEEQNHLAACVLLLEAAHIDDECTTEELDHVIFTLKNDFSLDQAHVDELIELARAERQNSIDLWQFTNHINQQYSKEGKMAVMESVWRIIFADGKLEMHEDYFAHKLANLMRLSHAEMIDAKLRAKK
jgi:uncharacterized tellurite resistance protein B-like protein